MSKKIVYITHWRIPSEKTMTPLILKTCQEFVREGYEVELWIPYRKNPVNGDPFSMHEIRERFPIHILPALDWIDTFGTIGFWLMVFTFNLSCYWRLQKRSGAILYGHDLRDFILPSVRRMPLFVEIHDFYESSVRTLNTFVLRRTTGLIVTNSIKMERLNTRYGFPLKRMLRQPNAVNTAQFAARVPLIDARTSLGLPKDKKIVLYTGHLFGWKGVYTLAESAQFLPADTLVYFVGGTEEDRATLQSFIKEKNIPRVVFVPHQPHEKMPLYLSAADVVALPNTAKEDVSKYETSPVKMFEYLAAGASIIASDIPSLRDVVSEREVTFFTPDDPHDLARALVEALHADNAAKQQAAQSLSERYTWEARGKHINTFIRALVTP